MSDGISIRTALPFEGLAFLGYKCGVSSSEGFVFFKRLPLRDEQEAVLHQRQVPAGSRIPFLCKSSRGPSIQQEYYVAILDKFYPPHLASFPSEMYRHATTEY